MEIGRKQKQNTTGEKELDMTGDDMEHEMDALVSDCVTNN